MTSDNCRLCKKSLDLGENDGIWHGVCNDEWSRRDNDSICTRCGQNPSDDTVGVCPKCYAPDTEYLGYPGP